MAIAPNLIFCQNRACRKLLCKSYGPVEKLEIKCRHCKTMNLINVDVDKPPDEKPKRTYTRKQV